MDPFINTTCQLRAYKYIYSSLGILCRYNAGVEEFPHVVQLHSVTTTTLSRRDANNIRGISFGFLDQFVFFSCEWSDVPVSDHQLMARLPFTRVFQVTQNRSTLRCPCSPPQMCRGNVAVAAAHEFATQYKWNLRLFPKSLGNYTYLTPLKCFFNSFKT